MTSIRLFLILALSFIAANCAAYREQKKAEEVHKRTLEMANAMLKPTESPIKPIKGKLPEIDLSRIGHIAPKGRVQDKEYNQLEIIDQLLTNPDESLPFLIRKLDDETEINGPVMDYWPRVTVGDVALVILTDFMTNPAGEVTPQFSWEELFGVKKDPKMSSYQYLSNQLARHNRGWLRQRWEATWALYKDRLSWQDEDKYFFIF